MTSESPQLGEHVSEVVQGSSTCSGSNIGDEPGGLHLSEDSERAIHVARQGRFYHDGRFPTVMAVVEHDNQFLKLGLTDA